MIWLKAKDVIAARRPQTVDRIKAFKEATGRAPGLAVLLVGDDPASQVYVAGKMKACEKVGLFHREVRLPAKATFAEVQRALDDLNHSDSIDAYLLQLPLPGHLPAESLLDLIDPSKDADGLTQLNLGRLFAGRPLVRPCTPQGVMEILKHYNIPIAGKRAVVVGRSQIVGKPMAQLLLEGDATVTVVHSKTPSVREFTSSADLVVVAAGRPEFLGREDFKPGAVVVDIGIHRKGVNEKGKAILCGDVRSEELIDHVSALTPVPGGVGPMTIQKLLENAVDLAESRMGISQ